MQQIQRRRTKRVEAELTELPTTSASDTSDVDELLTRMEELLDESR